MSRQASWQLDGSRASLRWQDCVAEVDATDPDAGAALRAATDDTSAPWGNFLGVAPHAAGPATASPLADVYVRGTDLIATYAPADAFPFRWQVYSRTQCDRLPTGDRQVSARLAESWAQSLAIELVVSIQTDLLDSRPLLLTATRLAATSGTRRTSADESETAGQALRCPPERPQTFDPGGGVGCFSFELAGGGLDYCEMVHPADFRRSHLAQQTGRDGNRWTVLSHELFSDQLEKGVILRFRALGLFLPRGTPGAMIDAGYRLFVDEQLPLTT